MKMDESHNEKQKLGCSHQLQNWKMILWFLSLNAIYIVIGMLSFEAIESEHEQKLCNDSSTALTKFVTTLTNHSVDGKYIVTEEELYILIKEAERYAQEGVPLGCTIFHERSISPDQ